MRAVALVCCMVCCCWACSGSDTPKDIIPRPRMQTILWQLIQSDEYVTQVLAKDSLKKPQEERMKKYQQVFDLNHTSLEQFKKSFRFYMDHPDQAKTMFDSLSEQTGRLRNEIYKPRPAPNNPPAAK